ncbi:MAG: hypothetical protein AAGH92_00920 [Planctomycetota bacterium]
MPPTSTSNDRTQQTLDDLADLFLTGTAPAAPLPVRDTVQEPEPAVAPPETDASAIPPKVEWARDEGSSVSPNAATNSPRFEAVLLGNLPGMAHVWLTQYAQRLAEQDGPVLLLTVNPDLRHDGQTLGGLEAELIEPRVGDVLHRFDPPSAGPDDHVEDDWFAPFPQTNRGASETPTKPVDDDGPQALSSVADLLREYLAETDPARRVATVLVYCDTHPRELDRLLDVGVWTLLTGADPTAVAAAQFGLEHLVEGDPQARSVEVGVFVVGSPADKATAAADQIATAASPLFDPPIVGLGHLQKMRPAAARTLGTFPRLDAQWAGLIGVLDDIEPTETAPARATLPEPDEPALEPELATEPERHVEPEPIVSGLEFDRYVSEPQPAIRESVLDDFFSRARHRTTSKADTQAPAEPPVDRLRADTPADSQVTDPVPSPTIEIESFSDATVDIAAIERPVRQISKPRPTEPEPTRPVLHPTTSSHDPDLATLLAATDPALDITPLSARCPEHPHLRLAADGSGRLHLLARLSDAEHPRPTLLALTDARRWASTHRELLALTMPHRPAADADQTAWSDPVLHLFTDQPDRAVPLAAAIDPAIRLHLLQHLPLDTGPTWLATPLQAIG